MKFLFLVKEKEERSPKVQLNDVSVLLGFKFCLNRLLLSFFFLFNIKFVIRFSRPCFFIITFAIHILIFPFSDRLCLVIVASLL